MTRIREEEDHNISTRPTNGQATNGRAKLCIAVSTQMHSSVEIDIAKLMAN